MNAQNTVSVSAARKKRVLEATHAMCAEVFRLISCDDARKEGFFRRAGPLNERFPVFRDVPIIGERTVEGVHITDGGNHTGLFNDQFSVNCLIGHASVKSRFELAFMTTVYLEGLIAYEHALRCFRFELTPEITKVGLLLRAQFDAREVSIGEFLERTDNKLPKGKSLIDYDKINGFGLDTLYTVYNRLLQNHPEGNHEMIRIALNLLSEFEAMLDSAIKHYEHVEGGLQCVE